MLYIINLTTHFYCYGSWTFSSTITAPLIIIPLDVTLSVNIFPTALFLYTSLFYLIDSL